VKRPFGAAECRPVAVPEEAEMTNAGPEGIYAGLVDRMGLRGGEMPSVVFETKSAPRRVIGQLVRRGFAPRYEDAPEDLKWLVANEGDVRPDETTSLEDLLGVYESEGNRVVVYDLLVLLCAFQLSIDPDALRQVVLTHELAHAATHRGRDGEDRIWTHFRDAEPGVKEYFAQSYTRRALDAKGAVAAIAAMEKLADEQRPIYRRYRESSGESLECVNAELQVARRAVPVGLELYAESASRGWSIFFDNRRVYAEMQHVMYLITANTSWNYPPRMVREGSSFRLSVDTLKVVSHDYRSAGSGFSPRATCAAFGLLRDGRERIAQAAHADDDRFPRFVVTLDAREYRLDLSEEFPLRLWTSVVDVIAGELPVFGGVLRGYASGFPGAAGSPGTGRPA
jgi:hypothetical protein